MPIKNLDIEKTKPKTKPAFVASSMKNVRLVFFDFLLTKLLREEIGSWGKNLLLKLWLNVSRENAISI